MSAQHSTPAPLTLDASGVLLRDLSADLLRGGYDVRFRAPGRSMHPAIREGDAILVKPVSPQAVRRGDIVLYRWKQGVIAHRVVTIDRAADGGGMMWMRGDAAGAQGEQVAPDQVLGKVVAAERDGSRIDLYGLRAKAQRLFHPLASRCIRRLLTLRDALLGSFEGG